MAAKRAYTPSQETYHPDIFSKRIRLSSQDRSHWIWYGIAKPGNVVGDRWDDRFDTLLKDKDGVYWPVMNVKVGFRMTAWRVEYQPYTRRVMGREGGMGLISPRGTRTGEGMREESRSGESEDEENGAEVVVETKGEIRSTMLPSPSEKRASARLQFRRSLEARLSAMVECTSKEKATCGVSAEP